MALDFGASSMVALKQMAIDTNSIDVVMLSHLHGDHFGGLPFLLLDSQFDCHRSRPLTIVGPEGTTARLTSALEVFFPGSSRNEWRFPLDIVDLPCRTKLAVAGFNMESVEVIHPSGAAATGLRVDDGARRIAYSGDTTWTDALFDVADEADLFIIECFKYEKAPPNHLDFGMIEAHRSGFRAASILLTHMSSEALARIDAMEAKGYRAATDGLVLDI